MIQTSTSVMMIINVILSFSILIVPFILFKNRSLVFKLITAGAMVFIFGDMFVSSFIMSAFIGSPENATQLVTKQPWIYALIAATVISVIHFFSRMFIMKGIVKQEVEKYPRTSGINMGFGQAAIESVYTIGLKYIQHLLLISKINNGSIYEMVSDQVTKEQIDLYIETIQSFSFGGLLLTSLKMIFYIVLFIALTLMTISAIRSKDKKQYALVILLNFSILFVLLISELILLNPIIQIGIVLLFGLILGYYISKQIKGVKEHEKI